MTFKDGSPAMVALLANTVAGALKAWPAFPDKLIPIACMVIGCFAYCAMEGLTGHNVVVGLCAGGAATGLHQAARQLRSPK